MTKKNLLMKSIFIYAFNIIKYCIKKMILSLWLCTKKKGFFLCLLEIYPGLKELNNKSFAHVNYLYRKKEEEFFLRNTIPEWRMFLCYFLPIQRIHNVLEKKKEDYHFDPKDVLRGMHNRKEAFYLHYEQLEAFLVVNLLHNRETENYGQWEFLKN